MILSIVHPPSIELLNFEHEVRCEAFKCYIAATIQKIGITTVVLAVSSSILRNLKTNK